MTSSASGNVSELDIRRVGGLTVRIELFDDSWHPALFTNKSISNQLLSGLGPSAGNDDVLNGWRAIVQPALLAADPRHLLREMSETMLEISLPEFAPDGGLRTWSDGFNRDSSNGQYTSGNPALNDSPLNQLRGYDISSPEVLVLTVPPECRIGLRGVGGGLGSTLTANEEIRVLPVPGTVSLAGDIHPVGREATVLSDRPYTLTLKLHDDYWAHSLRAAHDSNSSDVFSYSNAFAAAGIALLRGLSSINGSAAAGSTGGSWDSVVRQGLRPEQISFVDNQTIDVIIPQFAAYDIVQPETIAVSVPALATTSGADLTNAPSFTIMADVGQAALFGDFLGSLTETELITASHTLTFRLYNDLFASDIGEEGSDATAALLSTIVSEQSESGGFNAIIKPHIDHSTVTRVSDEQVDVTIPAAGVLYVISDPETIHIELPAATVQSKQTVSQVDPSSFIIRANPGAVTIAGGDDERACTGASACVLTMSEGMLVAGVSYYTFTITSNS